MNETSSISLNKHDLIDWQPNLQPPITSVAQALEYKHRLHSIEPSVQYLMALFVCYTGVAVRY